MNATFERVAIIGVGLIGGSLASAAREAGIWGECIGAGRDRTNLDRALADRVIDEATTDAEYAVRNASLVVLAAPADVCSAELMELVATHAPRQAIVTDVGSVKRAVVAAAERVGIGDRFVGTHPMAGGTRTGAAAADANLFRGRTVAVTPGANCTPEAVDAVERMWTAVGATTIRIDAAAHDRAVAATSHLPQVIAYALAATVGRDEGIAELGRLAGAGLDDMTRIAASETTMWAPILRCNRDNLSAVLDRFETVCGELRRAIADDDAEALTRVVSDAQTLRRRLPVTGTK